jgi:DNA modification methylase
MSDVGSFRLGLSRVEDLIESSSGGYDLIYIDPPFGLQRELHMTEADGTRKSFQDSWSNYDEYIEWLAGVIDGLYGLLKKDGWLYSHNQVEGNFLALGKVDNKVRRSYYTNISWVRSHPKNNISIGWGNIVDSIMAIRKGEPYFEVEHAPLDPTYAANSFGHEDERGNYALAPVTGEKSRPGHQYEYKGYSPTFGWRYAEERTRELDEQGLIHFGDNKPYKKIYLHESKGPPVQNIWTDIYNLTRTERNKRNYPTQKPQKMLERIVRTSCPPGGRVLDPFCGNGTTAIATFNIGDGRSCDTYDISEPALDIASLAMKESGVQVARLPELPR